RCEPRPAGSPPATARCRSTSARGSRQASGDRRSTTSPTAGCVLRGRAWAGPLGRLSHSSPMVVYGRLMMPTCFDALPIRPRVKVAAARRQQYSPCMGRRSGVVKDEQDLGCFSLKELDKEIARCKQRRDLAGRREVEKAFEKRIHMLERVRTRVASLES